MVVMSPLLDDRSFDLQLKRGRMSIQTCSVRFELQSTLLT